MSHHHEAWQIREGYPDGKKYCAACGATVEEPRDREDEELMDALAGESAGCICPRSDYEPYGIIPNPDCPEYGFARHKKRNPPSQ
jgi:hypothetical protein